MPHCDGNAPQFIWKLRDDLSEADVAPLRTMLPNKPLEPPGEAWFLGDTRSLFKSFVECQPKEIPLRDLEDFLREGTSGLASFQDCPDICEEYSAWFKYLLPDLILRAGEFHLEFLFEQIVTMFIRVFGPSSSLEPPFRAAVLASLGAAFLTPKVSQHIAYAQANVPQLGAVAAAMAFSLMYLPTENVSEWTKSVLAVERDDVRARLMVWIAAAFEPLKYGNFNSLATSNGQFAMTWGNSYLLAKSCCVVRDCDLMIPRENADIFLSTIRDSLSLETLVTWLSKLGDDNEHRFEYLEALRTGEYIADVVLAGK